MVGNVHVMRMLLSAGADVEARDGQGATALHSAARKGRAGAFKLLLAAGANPAALDGDGLTPAQLVVHHLEALALLTAGGELVGHCRLLY